MPMLADYCLDLALAELDTGANRLDIHSTGEPTTYANAIATTTLGNKTAIAVSAPADRTPNGRKVTISAITDGAVTATGTAEFWSIVNTTASRLLATGALASTQAVTSGNVFTTAAFDIGIPDAV